MADFDAKLQCVRNAINEENDINRQIKDIQDEVYHISNNLGFSGTYKYRVKRQLRATANDIKIESQNMQKLQDSLERVANLYEKTEQRICDITKDGNISLVERASLIPIHFPQIFASVGPGACIMDVISGNADVEFDYTEGNFDVEKVKEKIEKYTGDKKKISKKGYWDSDGWHEIDTKDKKKTKKFEEDTLNKTITIAQVTAKREKSYINLAGEMTGDIGSMSGNVNILSGEAHASGYLGLYTVGPDGKKKFSPGIGGEIGAGFTAFTAEGLMMLGDDDLGVYVKGNISAGKVEAKAGLDIGLVDKNGKINPQVAFNANMEAIVAEAEMALGGKLLGTDVSGNVGVNFGIGAHADIGIRDGKLSIDIGASLGLGVSADIDIDISGTIDKVAAVVSDAQSVLVDVAEGVGDAADAVGDMVNDIGKVASDAVTNIGKIFKW